MINQEVETIPPGQMQAVTVPVIRELALSREPAKVLAEAKKAADCLIDIMKKKEKKVMMNGKQYLEYEDWQTVAKFYDVTAKVVSTQFVQYGSVQGFEARAVAFHIGTGQEISAAEAMCLNDEDKWGARTKYEYQYVKKSGGLSAEDPGKDEIIWETKGDKTFPKKERVKIGEVQTPMFQLKSMAQTRACAKALRNVLSWVVVLAGYAPTPAEEMTGTEAEQDSKTAAASATEAKAADPGVLNADGSFTKSFQVRKVNERLPGKAEGKFGPYKIESVDGYTFNTFDEKLASLAKGALMAKTTLSVTYSKTKWGLDVLSLTPVAPPVVAAPGVDPDKKPEDDKNPPEIFTATLFVSQVKDVPHPKKAGVTVYDITLYDSEGPVTVRTEKPTLAVLAKTSETSQKQVVTQWKVFPEGNVLVDMSPAPLEKKASDDGQIIGAKAS